MTDPDQTLRDIWYPSAGTRLFAVEQGRGRPLVFLHGGLADHQASIARVGALASTCRVVTPDLRGSGRSHHADELQWDLLADDIVALLRHLELERAVIGGVSAGSAVALRFALRHPRRTAALLLLSPVYAGERAGLFPAQRAAFDRMNEIGQRTRSEGIEALLPLYDALPPAIRDMAVAMARRFDPASVAATTRWLAEGIPPFVHADELAALAMPTLVVPGTDPEHPAEVAELYARSIPHATLADPHAELATVMARFVAGLAGPSSSPGVPL